jgi:hypothetical protein
MKKMLFSGLLSIFLLYSISCRSQKEKDQVIPPVSFVKSAQVFEPNRTFQIGLVDLDGDGDLDAVFPNRGKIHSQVLLNDGKGYFTDSGQKLARQTHGMGIGDWDNDGDQDIVFVCAGYGENDVYVYLPTQVYLNSGQAVFTETGQDFGDDMDDMGGYVIDVSDIDSDGDLDFVKSFFRDPAKIYLNDGRGWFTESSVTLPKNSILGDLDGDGDHDAFVKVDGTGYRTLLNDGAGNFSEHWSAEDSEAIAKVRGMDVTLGDMDGDGDLDAFVTNGDREKSYPASVWLNDGTGRFTDTGQQLCLTVFAWVSLGDLNGDGSVDAYISNMGSPNQIWLNDGSGRFSDSGLLFHSEGETRGCSLGDLDGDGDLDIFVANFYNGCNEIWFNTLK